MNRLRQLAAAGPLADALIDDALAPTLVLDAAGVVLRAGAGYVALTGQTELVLPPAILARVAACAAAGEALAVETELLTAPPVPVALRLRPVQLHRAAALLQLTDLRPVRLLQSQLAQAQALGDVGRLAGGIAHDFNNLLTAVRGAAEDLAARPGMTPDALSDLELIRDGAQRGAALVRQLMEFGQQQVLRPQLIEVNAALRALAALLARLLGHGIEIDLALEEPGRVVSIDPVAFDRVLVNLAVNARDAMAGQGRLSITASRLMALDPVRDGTQTIPPGRYAVIELRDTGAGIPPEILPHIFTPFFTTKRNVASHGANQVASHGAIQVASHGAIQAASPGANQAASHGANQAANQLASPGANPGNVAGNGLGLATVHGIVRQSNGFLSVTSTPGQGACFRITLPSQRAAPPVRATPSSGAKPTAPLPAPPGTPLPAADDRETLPAAGHTAKPAPAPEQPVLLLVEDEAPVRLLAARALRRAGWTVLEADCAEAALDISAAQLACVVSDVIMPGLDGPGLVQALRRHQPRLRALLISGYADAAQRKALESHDINFLAKPFSPAELVAAVAHCAARAAAAPKQVAAAAD